MDQQCLRREPTLQAQRHPRCIALEEGPLPISSDLGVDDDACRGQFALAVADGHEGHHASDND